MQDFMNGRRGVDELTTALGALSMVLALIGSIFSLSPLGWIALIIVAVALFRAFSTNIAARASARTTCSATSPPSFRLARAALRTRLRVRAAAPATSTARSALLRRCGRTAKPRCTSSARTAARFSSVPPRQGSHPRHLSALRHQGREEVLVKRLFFRISACKTAPGTRPGRFFLPLRSPRRNGSHLRSPLCPIFASILLTP